MTSLAYHAGTSAEALAAEWGLSATSVRHMAAEASRRVRAAVCDPEVVAQDIGARLRRIMETGSDKDAVMAGRVWAEVAGAMAPKQIEYRVESSMSEDELRQRLLELQAKAAEYAPRQLPPTPCSVVEDVRVSQQPPKQPARRERKGVNAGTHPPTPTGTPPPGASDDQSRETAPESR